MAIVERLGLALPVVLFLLGTVGCDSRNQVPPAGSPKAAGPEEAGALDGAPPALPADPLEGDTVVDLAGLGESPSVEPSPPTGHSRVGRFEPKDDPQAAQTLSRLRAWVAGAGGKLFATVIDLEEGAALIASRATEPVNPASNMKVLTAAAALELLGPAYTLKTGLSGELNAKGEAEMLVLTGGGDPGLTTADLSRLVRVALGRGLTKVSRIIVDQRRFSGDFTPPAFEQQPSEWAPFRANISALALDGNSVSLNVLPGAGGEAARVWYEPPGVVSQAGEITSGKAGSGDRVSWRLDVSTDPRRPLSKVSGTLASELDRRRYSRRLEDPRLAGGYALGALLREQGVRVGDEVVLADSASDAGLLGDIDRRKSITWIASSPVAELVRPLGKDSDNFTAEMLLVLLSLAEKDADKASPWSSQRGAKVLTSWLAESGINTKGLVIKNGSGLFDANLLTTETIALVLARMEERPELFAEFFGQLSIYGADGTLKRRMTAHPARSRVRAKTGTLRSTDALSGYVLRGAGKRPLVFSFIVTGIAGRHGEVRNQLDRAVFDFVEAPN